MLITQIFCEITALEPSPALESDASTKLLCKKPPNTMTSSLANTATGMYNFLKFVKISKLTINYLPQTQILNKKDNLTILEDKYCILSKNIYGTR